MAEVPVLDNADYSGLEEFYADFSMLIKNAHELDRYYQHGKQQVDSMLPKYRKALAAFNKKYKDISLTMRRKQSALELLIMFKEEHDLQTFFARSASRIKGISAIGLRTFDEVTVSEADKVERLIQRMTTKLFLTYTDADTGTSTFMVQKKGKVILLVCDWKDLLIKTLPEFKLCAYYALRHPYQKKANVLTHAAALGFSHHIGLETNLDEDLEPFSRAH